MFSVEIPAGTKIRSSGTIPSRKIHGAASLAASQVSHCLVCFAHDHTMPKRLFTVNVEKLTHHVKLADKSALAQDSEARFIRLGKGSGRVMLRKADLEALLKAEIGPYKFCYRLVLSRHLLVSCRLQTRIRR